VRAVLGVPDQHGVLGEPDLDATGGIDAVAGREPQCGGCSRGSGHFDDQLDFDWGAQR
jgi:hypothetical protein